MNLEKIEDNLNKILAIVAVTQFALESGKLDTTLQSNAAAVLGVVAELAEEASEEIPFPQ